MQIGAASSSPGVFVQGRAPPGAVVFGIQVSRGQPCYWRGAQVREWEIISLWRGQEIDFHTHGRCELIAVAFEEHLFAEYARSLWNRTVSPGQILGRTLIAAPSVARLLIRRWSALEGNALRLGFSLCEAHVARQLESEAIEALLVSAVPPVREATMADRRRVAIAARRYMLDTLDEPPTIKAICEAVGASQRTLHQGFREAFGTSPKSFMKTVRLNAVRHTLRDAGPTVTVTEVAFHWGFFHLPRFAADYRRMFGELPSRTLRKRLLQ